MHKTKCRLRPSALRTKGVRDTCDKRSQLLYILCSFYMYAYFFSTSGYCEAKADRQAEGRAREKEREGESASEPSERVLRKG